LDRWLALDLVNDNPDTFILKFGDQPPGAIQAPAYDQQGFTPKL
jgi:hypothetical protein